MTSKSCHQYGPLDPVLRFQELAAGVALMEHRIGNMSDENRS